MTTAKTGVPWWYRANAKKALESWVRPLIAPRPYTVRYEVGEGSYMHFGTREIVIDPTAWDFMEVAKHLPLNWNGKRVDTEARLQWRFARTAARHEAMHVLFSVPPECGGILHFLVNALEDEWMEQLARHYYPAAWGDFVFRARLVTLYYPLPNPEECDRGTLLLNLCLYHRFDWKRKKGTPSRFRFRTEEDAQFWNEQIRPLVEKAWRTNEDAGRKDIAREILRLLDIPESAPLPSGGLMMSVNPLDVGGERGEDDAPLPVSVIVAGASAKGAASQDKDGKDEGGSAEGGKDEGGKGEDASAEQGDSETSGSSEGVGETEELPHDALVSLVSEDDEVPSPLTAADELYLLPPQYLENQVRGEKSRLLRVLLAKTPDVGEDASPAGGAFDLESYLRSDGARPFLLLDEAAPDHEGLAIALLIDTTGSMDGWIGEGGLDARGVFLPDFYRPYHRMTYARQVSMLFELVCPPAGMQLLIGAAGDDGMLIHLATDSGDWHSAPLRRKPYQPVTWLRDRSTPRESEVTRAAIAGLYGRYQRERISASLRVAERELAACRAGTRLIIYIHDGMPTDEKETTIISVLKDIRRKGNLVVAPYVGDQSDIARLAAIFGPQWTLAVPQLSDLSKRLGRLLLRYAHK
jgi:hypothetical protein